jgi:hypothetical protein
MLEMQANSTNITNMTSGKQPQPQPENGQGLQ